MDIRQYLALLQRQRLLVLATIVVVVWSTLAFYAFRLDEYRATAIVLLRPPDPNGRFLDAGGQSPPVLNIRAEAAFAGSLTVASEAAKDMPGADPVELRRKVTVTPDEATGLVSIHFTDRSPERARDVATAVAKAFVANRVQATADRSKQLSAGLDTKLQELAKLIDELTVRIGDRGLPAGPLNALAAGGSPGSLQAQRYAAALQYQQIFEGQQQLVVEQSLDRSGAELVTEAGLPRKAVGPALVQSIAIAGFVGALVGLALALLRDYLLDRVQSRHEVESAGHTVLAELPRDRRVGRGLRQLVCLERPLSPMAEGIRSLRTRLQTLEPERPLRSVVISSAGRGEGKSIVAANLATSFAQAGYNTILVGDLRRPAFDSVFGISRGGRNLAGLLAGAAPRGAAESSEMTGSSLALDVADALLPTRVPHLRYLAAGPVATNPDLLGSSRMTDILGVLTATTDIVVLDSPPVLESTDGAILANLADGVVLVTALGETRRGALASATGNLAGPSGRVLGIVLNKVTRAQARSAGYDARGPEPRMAAKKDRGRPTEVPTRPTADDAPPPREPKGAHVRTPGTAPASGP